MTTLRHTITSYGGSGGGPGVRSLERSPRLEVAEELCDIDREGVEQQVVFVLVGVEHPRVFLVGVDAPGAHPHPDAPAQAAILVRGAGEAARPRDLLGEGLEGPLVLLRRHDSALSVSRLALTSSCLGLISRAFRQS